VARDAAGPATTFEALMATDGAPRRAQANGYRLAFHGGADPAKVGVAVTAVPEQPDVTGVRSFCLDAAGLHALGGAAAGRAPTVEAGRCVVPAR
jgi:hypothetical protein